MFSGHQVIVVDVVVVAVVAVVIVVVAAAIVIKIYFLFYSPEKKNLNLFFPDLFSQVTNLFSAEVSLRGALEKVERGR